MTVALLGLVFSIVLIILGAFTLGRRGELSTQKTASEGVEIETSVGADIDASGAQVGASVDFFKGVRRGFEFYGEKETSEILAMVRQGRLDEAWPWAAMALGTLLIFLWLPLLIGMLAGLSDAALCLVVGFIFLGALFAAFPRRRRETSSDASSESSSQSSDQSSRDDSRQ